MKKVQKVIRVNSSLLDQLYKISNDYDIPVSYLVRLHMYKFLKTTPIIYGSEEYNFNREKRAVVFKEEQYHNLKRQCEDLGITLASVFEVIVLDIISIYGE